MDLCILCTFLQEQMEILQSGGTSVETDRLAQMLSFANTLCSTEAHELGMPDFPLDNLHKLAQIQVIHTNLAQIQMTYTNLPKYR